MLLTSQHPLGAGIPYDRGHPVRMMVSDDRVRSQIMGALWGAAAGDALGVPVEFRSRTELASHPITGLTGYGTHLQPVGTWSDDTSLILCTAESLLVCDGVDTRDMAERFHRWLVEAHWTPHGAVFDIGIATRQALGRFSEGKKPESCGGRQEYDNGNGSLMRMLPVSLWVRSAGEEEALGYVHRVSRITHAHPRSQMTCGFFTLLTWPLLEGSTPVDALSFAWAKAEEYYKFHEDFSREWHHLHRLIPAVLTDLPENEIRSTGYCVHTLEAAIWCLLHESTLQQTVLRAVNLGDDTDTVACVAGALAGLHYGLDGLPADWVVGLARHSDLQKMFENFTSQLMAET